MISKCFVYDDGAKENYNPFIKYDLIYSGSAGGVVYHYDRNHQIIHMTVVNLELF